MILQPGKSKGYQYVESDIVSFLNNDMLTPTFEHRTSLDQTTLNQSVSVNGVHSDNDTSQVRHFLDLVSSNELVFLLCDVTAIY